MSDPKKPADPSKDAFEEAASRAKHAVEAFPTGPAAPDAAGEERGSGERDPDWVASNARGSGERDPDWAESNERGSGERDPDWAESNARGSGERDPDWVASNARGSGERDPDRIEDDADAHEVAKKPSSKDG